MRDLDPHPFPKHKDLAIPLQSLLLGGSLFLFLPFRCIGSCTAGLPCTTASAALVHRFLNRREKSFLLLFFCHDNSLHCYIQNSIPCIALTGYLRVSEWGNGSGSSECRCPVCPPFTVSLLIYSFYVFTSCQDPDAFPVALSGPSVLTTTQL